LGLSEVAHNITVKLDALNLLTEIYKSKHNTDSLAKYLELTIETKDRLFSKRALMEIQNITFNEQIKQQELIEKQQQHENRLRMYVLGGILFVVLLLAGILYRNNRNKQKAKLKIEKAYEELKTTQAQLIQSEKMASLGEMTAGIAHEIQNPLNFINNFSEVNAELIEELNAERLKPNAERNEKSEIEILENIKQNLEKINHHGRRADSVVKGMLLHSRTSTGQKEPTNINVLADEYLRLAYHGLRAKNKSFYATIETDFDSSIGPINIVPQDIGRVLLNLYNNAFYAVAEKKAHPLSPEGGPEYEPRVTVSTKAIKLPSGGLGGEIRVSDNGNGIPQKLLDKIFQPFFTSKPAGEGTGLGLSISYDIIKAHGGEIKVSTKESKGSEFIIELHA
jgi:signal transduction histidine kinase